MELKDEQRSRFLALIWLEDQLPEEVKGFKKKFETDPADAIKHLRDNKEVYRREFGDDFLDGLGLINDNVVFAHFETMSWKNTKLEEMPEERLDECIRGHNIDGLKPDPSEWFLGDQREKALREEQGTLTEEDWVRIYARMWMDHRLNTDIGQEYKEKYGPEPKGYMEDFEKNPAATVKKIVDEINKKDLGKEITYTHGETRLYVVAERKDEDFLLQELPGCVRTGKIRDKPFRFVPKKC